MSRAAVPLSSIPTLSALYKSQSLIPSCSSSSSSSLASKVHLYQGDITRLEVDAIVNAANKSLLGGGGVDGAIHRAAGKSLLEECKTLNGCETGDAKVTKGYDLPSKYVVHTVGPVYSKSNSGKSEEMLRSAYRRSLEEASRIKDVKSIAFPSISTGVYGYPIADATDIAIKTVAQFFKDNAQGQLTNVVFCTFSQDDMAVYQQRLPHFVPDDVQ